MVAYHPFHQTDIGIHNWHSLRLWGSSLHTAEDYTDCHFLLPTPIRHIDQHNLQHPHGHKSSEHFLEKFSLAALVACHLPVSGVVPVSHHQGHLHKSPDR